MTYYFHHIPKTGGTTIIAWLDQHFQEGACTKHLWGDLLECDNTELSCFRFFRGHFYRALERYLGASVQPFTVLREPLARSVSHFRHIMRAPGHYYHELAKEQGTLLNFLRDPRTRPMIENFQTRSLTSIFDPVAIHSATKGGRRFALEQMIECLPLSSSPEEALKEAKRYLESCIAFGVTEQLDEFAECLSELLNMPRVGKLGVLNAEGNSVLEISSIEKREIEKATELDRELYQFALAKRCLRSGVFG